MSIGRQACEHQGLLVNRLKINTTLVSHYIASLNNPASVAFISTPSSISQVAPSDQSHRRASHTILLRLTVY